MSCLQIWEICLFLYFSRISKEHFEETLPWWRTVTTLYLAPLLAAKAKKAKPFKKLHLLSFILLFLWLELFIFLQLCVVLSFVSLQYLPIFALIEDCWASMRLLVEIHNRRSNEKIWIVVLSYFLAHNCIMHLC